MNKDLLPEGWTSAIFGDLVANHDGKRIPLKSADRDRRSGRYPYYGASGIIDDIDDFLFDGEFLLVAEDGANLLSRSTPIAFRASGKFWVNNHAHVVQPHDGIEIGWVQHYLNTFDLTFHVTGTAQPKLTQNALNTIPVLLAPTSEQERIVTRTEQLLAKVKSCEERLSRVPRIIKRFRQAVLAGACSGNLTSDWREHEGDGASALALVEQLCGKQPRELECQGAENLPEGWAYVRFKALCASIRGGSTVPPQMERTSFPILRSSSVRPGYVDLDDVKYVRDTDSRNTDNFIQDDDLLFTRLSGSIEYVANCAVVQNLGQRRIQYPDRLFCARLKDPGMVHFAVLCFGSPQVRLEITEHAKSSAGHQRVSITDITNQRMPLPPLREQHEIVRRVNALFALADQLEVRYRKARGQVDRISASILAKAFRGELVPTESELAKADGRSYETAEELLKRIATRKNGEAPTRRPRRVNVGA